MNTTDIKQSAADQRCVPALWNHACLWAFKVAECNHDNTLSLCVTVPGDSERSQCWGDLRHAPDSSSSPPPVIATERWPGQLLRGTAESCDMEGCWQVKRSPPHCSTMPVLTKTDSVSNNTVWCMIWGKPWREPPVNTNTVGCCLKFLSWPISRNQTPCLWWITPYTVSIISVVSNLHSLIFSQFVIVSDVCNSLERFKLLNSSN